MRIHELIRKMLDIALDDIHTALPARVERFDPVTLRGEVVPLVKRRVRTDGELEPLPPILDVPFWMPKAGPFILRLPVRRGDVVLVVFSERALDYLLVDGQPRDPQFRRHHALDDAIALPGLLHQAEDQLPAEYSDAVILLNRQTGTKLVMQENGETRLEVAPHVLRLVPNGPAIVESPDLRLGSDEAEEGVPLGKALKEWLDTHVHSHPDGPTGPPTTPSPAPSQKVKVE